MAGRGVKERLFEDLVAANQRRILAIARSYARGDECSDLCQEILLQMWRPVNHRENAYDALGRMAVVTAFLAVAWRKTKSRSIQIHRELERYLKDLKDTA